MKKSDAILKGIYVLFELFEKKSEKEVPFYTWLKS